MATTVKVCRPARQRDRDFIVEAFAEQAASRAASPC